MAPILYHIEGSPPARAARMVANAVGVNLDLKSVDLFAGEHLKPEFLKLNPSHTVPVLDDNGFVLWDSHAISVYLVEKYGKDETLYPKDVQKRALIEQYLHFDTGVLFTRLRQTFRPIFFENKTSIPQETLDAIAEAYGFIEKFLEGKKWLVGNSITIADIAVFASVTSLDIVSPVSNKWPQLEQWYRNSKAQPYHSVNSKGIEMIRELLKSKLQ